MFERQGIRAPQICMLFVRGRVSRPGAVSQSIRIICFFEFMSACSSGQDLEQSWRCISCLKGQVSRPGAVSSSNLIFNLKWLGYLFLFYCDNQNKLVACSIILFIRSLFFEWQLNCMIESQLLHFVVCNVVYFFLISCYSVPLLTVFRNINAFALILS